MANKEKKINTEGADIILHLNADQAKETMKAIELLLRLKINQYKEIPFALINLSDDDFCAKRDEAEPHLKLAFDAIYKGKKNNEWKDSEWYRLYNLYQVLRKSVNDVEHPFDCKKSNEYTIFRFTEEPLPRSEIVWPEPDEGTKE